jgi:hypothetical protein
MPWLENMHENLLVAENKAYVNPQVVREQYCDWQVVCTSMENDILPPAGGSICEWWIVIL